MLNRKEMQGLKPSPGNCYEKKIVKVSRKGGVSIAIAQVKSSPVF